MDPLGKINTRRAATDLLRWSMGSKPRYGHEFNDYEPPLNPATPPPTFASVAADIRAWFKTDGDPGAIAHLRRVLAAAMPGLTPRSWFSTPCVTTYTAHGYPYAGFIEGDRIALLAGGNGAAAKSSDEIGRLGARLVLDGALGDEGYATDFAVHLL